MDDYISRQVILKHLEKCKGQPPEMCYSFAVISEIERFVKSQLAADVAPVVHAKWEFNGICTSCSACGSNKPTKAHDHKLASREVRFCYFCGAKMDLEESK